MSSSARPLIARGQSASVVSVTGLLIAHGLALAIPFLPTRPLHFVIGAVSWLVIAFAIGAGLHRYFAHRSFRTSRGFQLLLALMTSAAFGDPIGFAAKHRIHHRRSDSDGDVHSPRQGLWRCWIGHLLNDGLSEAQMLAAVPDLVAYPELRWLHRHPLCVGTLTASAFLLVGGLPLLAVGYVVPWLAMALHGPSLVNYACHRFGTRPYLTGDLSTNNWLLGILFFGEGWHNNHHHYPGAARAGFRWYEVDLLYAALRLLAALGLVWDVRDVPPAGWAARRAEAK